MSEVTSERKRAAISWTGGKDCNLALKMVLDRQDVEPVMLVCFHPKLQDGLTRPRFRAHPYELQEAQAKACNLPLVAVEVTGDPDYKTSYANGVQKLRKEHGIDMLVTGDIDLVGNNARNFIQEVCEIADCRVECWLPLWNLNRKQLLDRMLDNEMQIMFTCVKSPFFSEQWIGRLLDNDAMEEMSKIENLDLCGENGEYHTCVVDCPWFQQRIEFQVAPEELHEMAGQKDQRWWALSSSTVYNLHPKN